MASFVELLGEKLSAKSGEVATTEALAGKVVGLYFSAHWCPPCRGFTPRFAEIYNTMVASGKNFEVVFVSSDRDESQFSEYYAEMPWLALPFDERDRKAQLSKRFGVSGIPSLVILDVDGREITRDGRSAVLKDPNGDSFPWRPPTLWQLLGSSVRRNNGEEVSVESLRSKVFGLYFSAKWCPPCCRFTSGTLIGAYNTLVRERGTDFEIVFVSLDRDEAQYNEYFASMPWTSLGFANPNAQTLAQRFQVSGIPTLVILDGANDAELITKNGVSEISSDHELSNFPWRPRLVNALESADNEDLNEHTCFIALFEQATPEQVERTKAALTAAAEEFVAKTSPPRDIRFFYSTGSELSLRLRQLCGVTQSPSLLILELPSFYKLESQNPTAPEELTHEVISSFLEFFSIGALDALTLDGR